MKNQSHMDGQLNSYFSTHLEVRSLAEKGFFGVYAIEHVPAGTLLVMWSGRLVEAGNLEQLDPLLVSRSIQVEETLYLVPLEVESADFVNHSCNPNAGISGQIGLVAMRDIAPGEEICFDYSMSDGSTYDEFECHCGESTCRQSITSTDWMLPELQKRYAGYFAPYLQRRIDRMKAGR